MKIEICVDGKRTEIELDDEDIEKLNPKEKQWIDA